MPHLATMFEPLSIRDVTLPNRVMMSPLSQHRAEDGRANDWHLVHYGSRAMGGVGLIMVEDCAVSPGARIGPNALGLWDDAQVPPLRRITSLCHSLGSRVGIQLGHAGRKAFGAQGAVPGRDTVVLGPTNRPFRNDGPVPIVMDDAACDAVVAEFGAAARRAVEAGFDVIEVHAAHGYLLHTFLSPLTNTRADAYGGDFGRRLHLLGRVVGEVRRACGSERALFMRISCVDWEAGGITVDDSVHIVQEMVACGVDVVDVSAGGLTSAVVGPQTVLQLDLAEQIRSRANVRTVGVGGVSTPEDAERLLKNGICDIVAVGRALMKDPFWLNSASSNDLPGRLHRQEPTKATVPTQPSVTD